VRPRAALRAAAAAAFSAAAAPAGAAARAPVVVELFTSQGCSSCPDADALLSTWGAEAFARGEALPLSYSVDYWNYLGWPDPFSDPAWSRRQRAYAAARGETRIYTPQLIVTGEAAFNGTALGRLRKEVFTRLKRPGPASLGLEPLKPGGTRWGVAGTRPPGGPLRRVMAVLFENGLVTAIPAGENAGKEQRNDFVVRRLVELGDWAAGKTLFAVEADLPLGQGWRPERCGAAVFLQDPSTLGIGEAAVHFPLAGRKSPAPKR